MARKSEKSFRQRGLEADLGALVYALNVEVMPALRELRLRYNEAAGEIPAAVPDLYVVTGAVEDRDFDPGTVTLPELANVVATLIADLRQAKVIR